MGNVLKIYERLTCVNVKQRFLPFYLPLQNIIMALVVLIFANNIISKGNIDGELNYAQIKLFYNLVIALLFVIVSVFAPFIFSSSLNRLVKNNTIDYILSVKVKIQDVIFAVFLRGFFTIIVLLVSALPIACVSFYFGGLSILKIMRILICLLGFTLIESSLSLYISSMIDDISISKVLSVFISAVLLIIHVLFVNVISASFIWNISYLIISIIFSLTFLYICRKGQVFVNN